MKFKVHIVVSGRVQGVFFRHFTRENAKALDLFGWVRNTLDGKVELMVEGEKCDLECLIEKIKQGPPLSIVRGVEIEWDDYIGEFNRFSVRYD
ncbi:MAG: acylphosphatase [Halobacteriota archaeon]|nr:acylphosphatase [Halobacteriota archaeon]